jgi:hypothetical protein
MKRLLRWSVLGLLSATMWAQAAQPATPKAKARTTTAASTRKAAASQPTDVQKLRDEVAAQQQQIQQLRDQLQQRDATMLQIQQQLKSLQSAATQAQTAAQTATTNSQQAASSAKDAQTAVASLKTTESTAAAAVQKNEKRLADLETPAKIRFRGITLTPGGYAAGNLIYRNHNTNADVTSNFGGIPFSGSINSQLSEFRLSARHSRISLLAEGAVKAMKMQGYFEMDFEGAAPTANEVSSNSFNPRVRELWANVDMNNGVSFLGGQNWSLVTPNRTGIGARGYMLPTVIDATYLAGFHYVRETVFRVTKSFGTKYAVAVAVENPETTLSVRGLPATINAFGFAGATTGTTGSPNSGFSAACTNTSCNTGLPSIDIAPDVVAKVAFDPGWGHFEVGGIARFFRDRLVASTATGIANAGSNHTTTGGGVTVNAVLPVVPKKVDVVIATLAGKGVGRFGTGGNADVTQRNDGVIIPLKTALAMVGVETHPTPKFDFYVYGGNEYYGRTVYPISPGRATGYGFQLNPLAACSVEIPTAAQGACSADNRDLWEITPGFWYRFYRGKEGTLQYGMQYEYIHRRPWSGVGGNPVAVEQVIMTSFRYYLP